MTPIKIIFEDDDILVLDKPAGITVNRSNTTTHEQTVQDFIEKRYKSFSQKQNETEDFYLRAGIVHRIDKETSGILLVAKNIDSFKNLQAQFKERKVNKVYIALVHGHVIPNEGEISVPVGRLPWNRERFGVLAGGRQAQTFYKTLLELDLPFTLLELSPKTGRTHQIRVHLKYINHPIFADYLYGGRKTARDDRKILQRVFLHASKISFFHPKTNKEISFTSPLPYELTQTIERLKH
ncbi:MAG: RluA family pseudouridine synthase [Candidatus Levybacteria bacterium]|nr:RluA family pseudouridine synthase [Candidatus Levybacteria bacterium]